MKTGKFYGVGVGPGDQDLLTLRAIKIIQSVDYIFHLTTPKKNKSIAGEIISGFGNDIKGELVSLSSPMKTDLKERKRAWGKNAEIILSKLKTGYDCAFITLGDPLIYSTCGYLLRRLKNELEPSRIEIVPGITSFQAAAAKTKTILADGEEKLLIIPAYKNEVFQDDLIKKSESVVLLKAYKTKNEIINKIISESETTENVYVSKLGLVEEIIERDLEKIKKLPNEYLSLFIIKQKNSEKECIIINQ